MEIHRLEKLWSVASLLLIVGFIATVTYGAVGIGVTMIGDDGTVDPSSLSEHPEFGDPGVREAEDGSVDVYVIARQYQYQPGSSSAIEVPANTDVTFHVTSSDVVHGFSLVGTNVNAMVIPGQVSELTVRFEETGTHGLVCHEYCGAGHHTMAGSVEVVPREEFFADREVDA